MIRTVESIFPGEASITLSPIATLNEMRLLIHDKEDLCVLEEDQLRLNKAARNARPILPSSY
jgi:hypothetical protein